MAVTVDGNVFEALLRNMVPGKVYRVTVSAVKGLEESDASTDSVTTGRHWARSWVSMFEVKSSCFLSVSSSFGPTSGSDCS